MKETQKPTIMIIEDDEMLTRMFEHLFKVNDMDVVTAFDGQDAIEKSKTIPAPTVILLDLMMPRVDGFAVLKEFKGDPRWKDIPIIVFSNLGDLLDQAKAIKLGAEEYMVKSQFSPKEVVERIQELITRHAK